MITVAVYINGNPVFCRSARNTGPDKKHPHLTRYKLDTGVIILHCRKDGAKKLALAMLQTVIDP